MSDDRRFGWSFDDLKTLKRTGKNGGSKTKAFCPTGPGGGVDPTCKPGSSSGGVGNLSEAELHKMAGGQNSGGDRTAAHNELARRAGYSVSDSIKDATKEAIRLGAPLVITKAKPAAEAIVVQMRQNMELLKETDPKKYEMWQEMENNEKPDAMLKNWQRNFRKSTNSHRGGGGAFSDVDEAMILNIQNAANVNQANELYQSIVKKGPAEVILVCKSETGNGANGEARAGVTFMYDTWKGSDVVGNDVKAGEAVVGGGNAGILRHEYGHTLHSVKLTPDQKKEWTQMYHDNRGEIAKSVSGYAGTNPDEFFAEVFTLRTHPKYNPDTASPLLKKASDKMLEWVL